VFQEQNVQARRRHGEVQLYAGNDVTGSKSSPITIYLRCENLEVANLKGRAEAYMLGFSKM